MNIRKAENNDLKTIVSLSPQAVFDGTLGEARPSHSKIDSMVNPLLEKGGFYLVAIDEEKIVGWLLLGTTKDQFTDEAIGFIYEIYILKDYRGQGFSKELMKAAIMHFRQEGYAEVRLSAKADNPAVRIYENVGFKTRTVSMSLNLK
ncbi:ribosomal protein S18 acetylase RimI-like enzyme [Planomicrobium koreense]|uniref:Ribosomal protein S18 acetylase RimI-like enzyme n=2 Tax=Planococcus koreensis TaxID=112331 RepID=A0A7W8CUK2_9BACL|nr:GNAT family N-acetyltransferase [Planococcus koreensis]MBB5181576.1 ribosomal protein S18 acetylase RimI-like enzyme [Planococcus koreensis]